MTGGNDRVIITEKETDCVQWFRAKTERERWQEMLEKLEADFQELHQTFRKDERYVGDARVGIGNSG
ncbi:hypothetical protein PQX77_018666 [Marasmius sp. AFHP31]|nr:hypothetical protein PQX77_018666 [Marasmius sp. AFHP31]